MKQAFQVIYTIYEGMENDFIEASLANLEFSRQEHGNVQFDVFRNVDDPLEVYILEVYEDEDALQAHFQTEHFKYWKHATQNMIVDSEIKPLEVLG